MGEYFYINFVARVLTTGGPGDALQNPDSESCYALMEFYTVLYETTEDEKWLIYAKITARHFSTWVIYQGAFKVIIIIGYLTELL